MILKYHPYEQANNEISDNEIMMIIIGVISAMILVIGCIITGMILVVKHRKNEQNVKMYLRHFWLVKLLNLDRRNVSILI